MFAHVWGLRCHSAAETKLRDRGVPRDEGLASHSQAEYLQFYEMRNAKWGI
jgi:hypothetical protein